MSKDNIELDRDFIAELMKSQEIVDVLEGCAETIAAAAGNCVIETQIMKKRARVRVVQNMTQKDRKDNTLLKAVHFK